MDFPQHIKDKALLDPPGAWCTDGTATHRSRPARQTLFVLNFGVAVNAKTQVGLLATLPHHLANHAFRVGFSVVALALLRQRAPQPLPEFGPAFKNPLSFHRTFTRLQNCAPRRRSPRTACSLRSDQSNCVSSLRSLSSVSAMNGNFCSVVMMIGVPVASACTSWRDVLVDLFNHALLVVELSKSCFAIC